MSAWPTRHIPVTTLVSADAAARQEAALEHACEALRLTQGLLDLAEVAGDHRLQLEEVIESLEDAVDYLGPVEELVETAVQR